MYIYLIFCGNHSIVRGPEWHSHSDDDAGEEMDIDQQTKKKSKKKKKYSILLNKKARMMENYRPPM